MAFTCRTRHSVKEDLQALRGLTREEAVVLFTPSVLPPAQPVPPREDATPRAQDHAFAAFGAALVGKRERYIDQATYGPMDLFTDRHEEFIEGADAVIVVICEPPDRDLKFLTEVLYAQYEFACSTYNVLHDEEVFDQDDLPPLFIIQFGNTAADYWPDLDRFENLIDCSKYGPEVFQAVYHELFES